MIIQLSKTSWWSDLREESSTLDPVLSIYNSLQYPTIQPPTTIKSLNICWNNKKNIKITNLYLKLKLLLTEDYSMQQIFYLLLLVSLVSATISKRLWKHKATIDLKDQSTHSITSTFAGAFSHNQQECPIIKNWKRSCRRKDNGKRRRTLASEEMVLVLM